MDVKGIQRLIDLLKASGQQDKLSELSEAMAEILFEDGGAAQPEEGFANDPPSEMLDRISKFRAKFVEIEKAHELSQAYLPKHDWADWYAAYSANRAAGVGPVSSRLTSDLYIRWLLRKVAESEAKANETPAPVQSTVTPEEKVAEEKLADSGMTGE